MPRRKQRLADVCELPDGSCAGTVLDERFEHVRGVDSEPGSRQQDEHDARADHGPAELRPVLPAPPDEATPAHGEETDEDTWTKEVTGQHMLCGSTVGRTGSPISGETAGQPQIAKQTIVVLITVAQRVILLVSDIVLRSQLLSSV